MWEIVVTALAFVLGMFAYSHYAKRKNRGKALKEIDHDAAQRRLALWERLQSRLKGAKKAADASVADRPHTDDPVADLRDRLDR